MMNLKKKNIIKDENKIGIDLHMYIISPRERKEKKNKISVVEKNSSCGVVILFF